ncbi:MAG: peptidylprolyl isomerase [Candidatus Izemoplasmatales bacterium]
MKRLFLMLLVGTISFSLISCKGDLNTVSKNNPVVTITFENYDPIMIELYPDVAPNTVNNFIYLVSQGYYDGLTFHRIIEGFMIQGGAGSTLSCKIAGEFSSNGITNDLSHTRGVISMARTTDKNSATSQFFIVHADSTYLDGNYAAFGMMISGFETLDALASVDTDYSDRPLTTITMKTVTVDTRGETYPDPTCY